MSDFTRWVHSYFMTTDTLEVAMDYALLTSPVIGVNDSGSFRSITAEREPVTTTTTAVDTGTFSLMYTAREPATTTATTVDTGSFRNVITSRFANDTGITADLVTHGAIIVNSETVTVTDLVTHGAIIVNSETVIVLDSAKQNSFIRRNTDNVIVTITLVEEDGTFRVNTDPVTITDTGSLRSVTTHKTESSVITATISIFKNPGKHRKADETVIATDTPVYAPNWLRAKTDLMAVTDTGTFRIFGYIRTTNTTATVSDTANRVIATTRINTDSGLISDAGTYRAETNTFINTDTVTVTDVLGSVEQTVKDRIIFIRNIKTVETVVFEPGATDEYGQWPPWGNFLAIRPSETKNVPPAYICNSPPGARTRLGAMAVSGMVSVAETYLNNTSRVLPPTALYNYSADTNPMIQFVLHRSKAGAVDDADPTIATSGMYSRYNAILLRCMFDGTIGTGETTDIFVWGRELYATSKGPWAIIYSNTTLAHGEEIEVPTRKRYIWVQLKNIVLAATGTGLGVWVSGY